MEKISNRLAEIIKAGGRNHFTLAQNQITISMMTYGYMVQVGCTTWAFLELDDLLAVVSEYLRHPDEAQKIFNEASRRSQCETGNVRMGHGLNRALTPEPPPPIGWDGR